MSTLLAKTVAATAFSSDQTVDPAVRAERAPRRLSARRGFSAFTGRASGFALFHDWSANKAA